MEKIQDAVRLVKEGFTLNKKTVESIRGMTESATQCAKYAFKDMYERPPK